MPAGLAGRHRITGCSHPATQQNGPVYSACVLCVKLGNKILICGLPGWVAA